MKSFLIDRALATFKKEKIHHTVFNDGIHIRISKKGGVDFWPTTQRFRTLDGSVKGQGINNLIQFLNEKEETERKD